MVCVGVDIFRSRSTRPTNSSGRCWRRGGSRRREEGNTRELERPSQRQRRRPWSCKSKHSSAAKCHPGLIIFLSHSGSHVLSRRSLARHANRWYPEPRLGLRLSARWLGTHTRSIVDSHLYRRRVEIRKWRVVHMTGFGIADPCYSYVGSTFIKADSISPTQHFGGRRFQPGV